MPIYAVRGNGLYLKTRFGLYFNGNPFERDLDAEPSTQSQVIRDGRKFNKRS